MGADPRPAQAGFPPSRYLGQTAPRPTQLRPPPRARRGREGRAIGHHSASALCCQRRVLPGVCICCPGPSVVLCGSSTWRGSPSLCPGYGHAGDWGHLCPGQCMCIPISGACFPPAPARGCVVLFVRPPSRCRVQVAPSFTRIETESLSHPGRRRPCPQEARRTGQDNRARGHLATTPPALPLLRRASPHSWSSWPWRASPWS